MIRLHLPRFQCVLFASIAVASISLVLGASVLAAVGASSSYKTVDEAELAKALDRYHSIARLKVDFKQKKFLKDMDMAIESEGELKLEPPGLVVYQIQKPSKMKVTLDPEQIKIENGSGPSATVQTIKTSTIPGESEKRNLKAMVTWLKMDPHALSEEYEISSDHASHFRFQPRQIAQSPFRSLEMELSKEGHVTHLTMNEQSGDRIEFFFETPKITYLRSGK
jgi:hypothetical protein